MGQGDTNFETELRRQAIALGIIEGLPLEGVQGAPVKNYLQMAAGSYDGDTFTPGPFEPMEPVPSAAPLYTGLPPQWSVNDPPGTRMIPPWPLISQSVRDQQEQSDRESYWRGR